MYDVDENTISIKYKFYLLNLKQNYIGIIMTSVDCYLMVNIIKTKTIILEGFFNVYSEDENISSICKHIPFDSLHDDNYFYSYSVLKAIKYIRSKIDDDINLYIYTDMKLKLNQIITSGDKYAKILKKILDRDNTINIIFTSLKKDSDKEIIEELNKIFMRKTKDYTSRYNNKTNIKKKSK
jgi:hypothetical protein